jgi:hypothetical protein
MLESIPCLLITCFAGFRIAKIHKSQTSHQGSSYFRSGVISADNYTPSVIRSPSVTVKRDVSLGDYDSLMSPKSTIPLSPLSSRPSSAMPSYGYGNGNTRSPSVRSGHQTYHLPFPPPSSPTISNSKLHFSHEPTVLSGPPTVVRLSSPPATERNVSLYPTLHEDARLEPAKEDETISPQRSSVRWDSKFCNRHFRMSMNILTYRAEISRRSQMTGQQKKIVPLIWRLVLFHGWVRLLTHARLFWFCMPGCSFSSKSSWHFLYWLTLPRSGTRLHLLAHNTLHSFWRLGAHSSFSVSAFPLGSAFLYSIRLAGIHSALTWYSAKTDVLARMDRPL